jgi:hypothetical protein
LTAAPALDHTDHCHCSSVGSSRVDPFVPNAADVDFSQESLFHPRESGLPSLQRSFSNDVLQPFFQ